jgi:hypothetical protein
MRCVPQFSLEHCVRLYKRGSRPRRRKADAKHGAVTHAMPFSEHDSKEALRAAADWLVASELPGSAAPREGIADTIPLVMMGMVEPDDLDDLAAIVEEHGRAAHDATTRRTCSAQLKLAVKAAFDYVRSLRRDAAR